MNIDELKKWFWNRFNSCYLVVHDDFPESILMCYDEKFIRKLKLNKLSGKETTYPIKPSGIYLFEQSYKNRKFYMDYVQIVMTFQENYSNNWNDINNIIGI